MVRSCSALEHGSDTGGIRTLDIPLPRGLKFLDAKKYPLKVCSASVPRMGASHCL